MLFAWQTCVIDLIRKCCFEFTQLVSNQTLFKADFKPPPESGSNSEAQIQI